MVRPSQEGKRQRGGWPETKASLRGNDLLIILRGVRSIPELSTSLSEIIFPSVCLGVLEYSGPTVYFPKAVPGKE